MATILLVEADGLLLDLMQLALEQRGYALVRAQNGADALAAFLQHLPSVVVLDLFLPQTDVLDLIRRMKKKEACCAILVLSAFGFREVVQQALQAGAQDYLLKPLNMDTLLERVNKALQEVAAAAPPTPATPTGKNITKPAFRRIR